MYSYVYKKNNELFNKLGIAVSRKQGKAVKRNYIKRLIRENYKNYEDSIKKGYSFLIILNKKKSIEEINFKDIQSDFLKILKKAELLEI